VSKEDPNTLDYTTPLYISHRFLVQGHNKDTLSATGTFVRFKGLHYVVTCRHVLALANHSKYFNLSIVVDRIHFGLSNIIGPGPAVSSFRTPLDESGAHQIDVCISPVDHAWGHIVQVKGKKAVDLDSWTEPDWANISTAFACGWLNKKDQTDTTIITTGIHVYAELGSKLSQNDRQFTMHSETGKSDGPSLSGLSGGLIHTTKEQGEIPFGIVFEGYPGDESAHAFLKPGDIMVRGHVLTPQIFQNWLTTAQVSDVQSEMEINASGESIV
jgi:hypothetical protein